MEQEVPIFAPLFFAAFMAAVAFLYIRFPDAVHQIQPAYSVATYRTMGWIVAAGSVAMLITALALWLMRRGLSI